jgi:hypothetical protein
MTTATEMDMTKAQAFGGKALGFINGWAAAMCLSVGHRTGLFDAMGGSRHQRPSRSPTRRAWTSGTFASGYTRWWSPESSSTTEPLRRTPSLPSMQPR